MKRFAAFSGFNYYPSGGWNDFIGSFDTLKLATEAAMVQEKTFVDQWWHIVDLTTGEKVLTGGKT